MKYFKEIIIGLGIIFVAIAFGVYFPEFFESTTLLEEFSNASTNETLPDCRQHSWYECPYPLHIIGPALLVALSVYGILGYYLTKKMD